jgi:Peptidase family M23
VPLLFALAALAAASDAFAQGYAWPLKPFGRQHPIRGNFGDPRTEFEGGPGIRSIMGGSGKFAFHSGIDIPARAGQAVYAVKSGTVRVVSEHEVAVDSPDGTTTVYWHISRDVSTGDAAVALQTVVGRVLRSAGHLHFGEFENGSFVNPLARGHLHPYIDRKAPRVQAITIRRAASGAAISPLAVRGRIKLTAEAFDTSARPVTGAWAGLPVAPVLVEWRLQRWSGAVAIPETVAADFRRTLPPRSEFWNVYARGTYQNMPVFGSLLAYRQPGRYVFNLTPNGLDTHRLKFGNDTYDVVVIAVDIRGNTSTLTQRITVRN